MKKNIKKKGFTLIELIVVIAILGILAAIAVPRFADVQLNAKKKADAATAAQMVKIARMIEAEDNLTAGTVASPTAGATWSSAAGTAYMDVPATAQQSATAFTLSYDGTAKKYKVSLGATLIYTEP